jgi:N-acetylglutamate synthase-like GNAT family acetyltransferase
VIERGGAPLAFLAREGSYIHALFVSPEAQGAGLGRRLLRHAKTQAARLDLWTFAENHGARRFYRREGFTPTERPPASDEGLPEVHLTWQRDPRGFSVRKYPGGAPQERGAAPPSPLTDKDPR